MQTPSEYLDIIDEALEKLLEEKLPTEPRGIYAPIRYVFAAGGKRLRPVLCLAVAEALGAAPKSVINQALAIEIFHNFTLLHDDVMDKSEVRRGHPTVHCRWNENTAILSGDLMMPFAYKVLGMDAGDKLLPAYKLLTETMIGVCEGQQLDMDYEGLRKDVTVDDYLNMIRLKTGVLLGCACAMGTVMAGRPDAYDAFYEYGVKLGMAFQLRDDYLDSFGDPALFGKQIGGDILCDKKTWLLINALQRDDSGQVAAMIGTTTMKPAEKIERVQEIYTRLGLDEECNRLIDNYLAEADAALKQLNLSPEGLDFFLKLTDKSRTRCN